MKESTIKLEHIVLTGVLTLAGCGYTILQRNQPEEHQTDTSKAGKDLNSVQQALSDTVPKFYFPLQLGNEWVYNHYDTIRVDSTVSLSGEQYYHLSRSIPVWVSYKRKYTIDYWLTSDEKGNVYALVDSVLRPLMLFDQEKISLENYFGWDNVLLRTSLTHSDKKIPVGDYICTDGVVVSHFNPAQRGETWIFCNGVGLVFFEEEDHFMYNRLTLTSYKIRGRQ